MLAITRALAAVTGVCAAEDQIQLSTIIPAGTSGHDCLANMELGFLAPPVGLNLLLASSRFKKPVAEVSWAVLPMLGVLFVGVLIITYCPWLTTALPNWLK